MQNRHRLFCLRPRIGTNQSLDFAFGEGFPHVGGVHETDQVDDAVHLVRRRGA